VRPNICFFCFQRNQHLENKRLNQRQYHQPNGGGPIIKQPNNRAPIHKRQHDEPLLRGGQPQIMAAGPGHQQYYPYPQGHPQGLPQGQTYLFPEHQLLQHQYMMDNRFVKTTLQGRGTNVATSAAAVEVSNDSHS
jgi:hypothetical protein